MGAFYYFGRPATQPGGANFAQSKSNAPQGGIFCQNTGFERRTLKVNFVPPPEFLRPAMSRPGALSILWEGRLANGERDRFGSKILYDFVPNGPMQFEYLVRCGSFARSDSWGKENTNNNTIVRIRFCPDVKSPGNCDQGDKHIQAFLNFPGDPASLKESTTIDFGRVIFSRNFLSSGWLERECLPGPNLLSGQVIPTEEFLKKLPPGKKVVLSYHDFTRLENLGGEMEAPLIRKGPFNFSFPKPTGMTSSGPLSMRARICEANESVAACVSRIPYTLVPVTAGQDHFRLFPKNLEFPTCGQSNITFYLHWLPVPGPISNPVLPHDRDNKIPSEIIEGALVL